VAKHLSKGLEVELRGDVDTALRSRPSSDQDEISTEAESTSQRGGVQAFRSRATLLEENAFLRVELAEATAAASRANKALLDLQVVQKELASRLLAAESAVGERCKATLGAEIESKTLQAQVHFAESAANNALVPLHEGGHGDELSRLVTRLARCLRRFDTKFPLLNEIWTPWSLADCMENLDTCVDVAEMQLDKSKVTGKA
jgi:hypothetical protein